MLLKTLGCSSVSSAVAWTSNPSRETRIFSRMETTSMPVQPPSPDSSRPLGLEPLSMPPESRGASRSMAWPPWWAVNAMPEFHFTVDFMGTSYCSRVQGPALWTCW